MIEFIETDERVTTGSAEIDAILGGGFPVNSINIIMGQPGSGKTVFAEQMAFHNADDARPILYLTTFSEPVAKVLKYLQRFTFYDEASVGTAVIYDDVGARLAHEGIEALVDVVSDAIHAFSPKIIIIDSYKALHDISPSVAEMRRMLYELTGLLTAYATTVFLVGEYSDEDAKALPEFAVADGIIQLLRSEKSTRDERFLRVVKLRGSGYFEGMHSFRITRDGLDVFPRLVTPEVPEGYEMDMERIPSGIVGLDALIGGGLLRGRTTLLAGPSGAGKTTMALRFALQALEDGEAALYVNFQENPTQLATTLRAMGVDPAQAASRGFKLMYASPVELQIDSLIVTLFRRVREEHVKRIVIDAVGDLMSAASDQDRLHDFLYALVQHFAISGVTSLLNFETTHGTDGSIGAAGGRFSYMSDNIVLLAMEMDEMMTRTVRIVKSRGTAQDLATHRFTIGAEGATVV